LRLAFLGTPDFAVATLKALIDAGHDVVCVYTRPPRPAGRGMEMRPSPIEAFARERGIEVRSPQSLKPEEEQAAFAALGVDAAVVVAYGLLLPPAVIHAPRFGCFNVHASLLPRWRGAAPIERAIMAGDAETGISIMQMDEGLDTGPVLVEERVAITQETTAGTLHDALATLGAGLMVRALEGVAAGTLDARPQPEEGATYAAKLAKAESRIDWARSAQEVSCRVRALSPVPGAWFEAKRGKQDVRVRVLEARIVEGKGAPGEVIDGDGLTVACGSGALRLLRLQRAGGKPMEAGEFLRGMALPAGTRLG
jgi:methionyl-tRNA formyltransferase